MRQYPTPPVSVMTAESESTFKLLVSGSRSIKNDAWVRDTLNTVVATLPRAPTLLIHGGAIGVDKLAGKWAMQRDLAVKVVNPDFKKWPIGKYRWKAYGVRDKEMVDEADTVVCLWDGRSKGTRLTMEYAEEKGKFAKVVYYHT